MPTWIDIRDLWIDYFEANEDVLSQAGYLFSRQQNSKENACAMLIDTLGAEQDWSDWNSPHYRF